MPDRNIAMGPFTTQNAPLECKMTALGPLSSPEATSHVAVILRFAPARPCSQASLISGTNPTILANVSAGARSTESRPDQVCMRARTPRPARSLLNVIQIDGPAVSACHRFYEVRAENVPFENETSGKSHSKVVTTVGASVAGMPNFRQARCIRERQHQTQRSNGQRVLPDWHYVGCPLTLGSHGYIGIRRAPSV
jgi:hypothetical protein